MTCNGGNTNNCLTCEGSLFFEKNYCNSKCSSHKWANDEKNTCDECSTNCLTCKSSATNCLSCGSTLFLEKAKCISKCPDGKYGDTSKRTCEVCDNTCKTCDAAGT